MNICFMNTRPYPCPFPEGREISCGIVIKIPAGKKPMPAPSPSPANSVLTTAKRLARESKPQKVTAARLDSAEVLKAVRNETITVTRNGKPAAVVISPARYRGLMRVLAAFMEEMEHREWSQKARAARKDGFIGYEESEAFIRNLGRKHAD